MSILTDLLTRGGRRTHAAVTLAACVTLCTSILVLSAAAYQGRQVQVELAAVVTALSTLVGWIYKVGKQAGAEAPAASGVSPSRGCAVNPTGDTDRGTP